MGYPVLFIPKKNGKLRIYINYKQLNSIIKKILIPIIIDLRNLRPNRQRKDLFKDRSEIGILSD